MKVADDCFAWIQLQELRQLAEDFKNLQMQMAAYQEYWWRGDDNVYPWDMQEYKSLDNSTDQQ